MPELKPIALDSIPRALAKAERYRLLNEPWEAESICRDVLAADPQNQQAVVCLILAMTDLFASRRGRIHDLRSLVASLSSPFERAYYAGVVEERWAKSLMNERGSMPAVHDALQLAMAHFEEAEALAPEGNDDAVLRWNTCVRLLEREEIAARREARHHSEIFDEDVPMR